MAVRKPLWFIKVTRYEFWPVLVFYFPFFFYWLYLSFKARDFGFLFRINPDMKFGGAIGADKVGNLDCIAQRYLPMTLLIAPDTSFTDVTARIEQMGLEFPLIAKPNNGERGKGVEKIANLEELQSYFLSHLGELILQEFIDSKLELGVLYYRDPISGDGKITSIVKKGFLMVKGDGKSTLKELIKGNIRARFREAYLHQKFSRVLNDIIPENEELYLEPVGNHCRGTEFISGQKHISEKLTKVFDEICAPLPRFDYGRFDIKVESIERLNEGKTIKIMEINGVNAEPAHIYDKSYTLLKAYKVIKQHFDILFSIAIAKENVAGERRTSFSDFMEGYREHTRPSA